MLSNRLPFYFLGNAPYRDQLIAIAHGMSINVAGVTGKPYISPAGTTPLPNVSRKLAIQEIRDGRALGLQMDDYRAGHDRLFWNQIQHSEVADIAPGAILHPGALISTLSPDNPHLFAMNGFPGSGNHLMLNLTHAIQKEATSLAGDGPNRGILSDVAHCYCWSLRAWIEYLSMPLGEISYEVGSSQTTCVGIRIALPDGSWINLDNIPYCGFLGNNFAGHCYMTQSLSDYLSRAGYIKFLVVRNPFDTMASVAAKAGRPLTKYLHDSDTFESLTRSLAIYLKLLAGQKSDATILDYDATLSDPNATMRRIENALGLQVTNEIRVQIIKNTLYRPLTQAGLDHFNTPGESKLKYYTSAMLQTMEKYGFKDLCDEFGWHWPQASDLPPSIDTKSSTPSPLFGITGRRCASSFIDKTTGIEVWGANPKHVVTIAERLQSTASRIFLSCLADQLGQKQQVDEALFARNQINGISFWGI